MKKNYPIIFLLLINIFAKAQNLTDFYTIFEETTTYENLNEGTRNFYGENQDDAQLNNIAIGFTFNYNGNSYTELSIGINGAISFTESTINPNNILESTVSGSKNMIAPLWDDLFIRAADEGQIWFQTQGTTPNRKFVVEWRNISWRDLGNTVSFKLILFETTNNIAFEYGTLDSMEIRSASIGISRGSTGDDFISLTPNINGIISSSTTANNNISTNNYPGVGKRYLFKHLTYIPDDNFENYLETHDEAGAEVTIGDASSLGNGIANDDYVSTPKVDIVTSLDIHSLNIYDLTGIEDFREISELYCNSNHIASLDLSENTNLTYINCSANNLTTLDFNANTLLTHLYCYGNNLTMLNITANPALKVLNCSINNLTSIDVSENTVLSTFYCYSNNLSSLDLSANTALLSFSCSNNNLVSLDFSANSQLNYIDCNNNNITDINLGENHSSLRTFYCHQNQLTGLDISTITGINNLFIYSNNISSIDLSSNTVLQYFNCENNILTDLDFSSNIHLQKLNVKNNNLTTINIQNGANNLLQGNYTSGASQFARFRATGNPNLTCIFVDNATDANSGAEPYTSWEIDPSASYVANESECNALGIDDTIQNVNFRLYPNPSHSNFSVDLVDEQIIYIKIYDLTGKLIKSYSKQENYNIIDLHTGIYMIRVDTMKGYGIQKLIIN